MILNKHLATILNPGLGITSVAKWEQDTPDAQLSSIYPNLNMNVDSRLDVLLTRNERTRVILHL